MSNSTAGQIATLQGDSNPRVVDYIARGLGSPQMGSLVALSAALTLGVGMILWAMKPDMTPVFDQLGRQDMAQVVDQLRVDNIPFEIQTGTGLVLVPQDQLDSIRMKLAATGIPADSSVGLELLQKEQSLGTSQFMETTRYQHALETELSRTISSMRNVDTARVHLALPKQSVFIRNRAKSSASVMVKLFPGRVLERGQVDAIVNLVASSIPYLEPSQVTVVDQWGKLFSSGGDENGSGETRKQFEYSRQLENVYAKRIETLLTPLVGEGNVRATVTANVDFTLDEQTQELFQADPAKIRSEQSQDQSTTSPVAMGVPGALTNQPPEAGTTDPEQAGAEPKDSVNSSKSTTRNYELDKTIKHTRKAPGTIQQVSAAVIIDDRKSIDEAGEVVRTPLTPEEIERFTSLVREAIGYNEARGDSVVVLNQSFQPVAEIEPIAPLPIWEQPWVWTAGKQVLAGLAVLLLILLVVRPAMKNLKRQSDPAQLTQTRTVTGPDGEVIEVQVEGAADGATVAGGAGQNAALEPPQQVYGDILNLARAMADEDPKRVAKVVKDWVGTENE